MLVRFYSFEVFFSCKHNLFACNQPWLFQDNVEFDNGKNEGDEITSFAEEEVVFIKIQINDKSSRKILLILTMTMKRTGEVGRGSVVRPRR